MSYKQIEEKQFEVAKDFEKSKLKSQTMKFTNSVMMSLINDVADDYECVSEVVHQILEVRECISKDAKIKFSGIQLIVENKGEMSKEVVEKLSGYGFIYQYGSFYDDKNESTTIFGQSPDYWDKDFEEFLQTYNEFKRKKYEKLTSQNLSDERIKP